MNQIAAVIANIEQKGSLALIEFDFLQEKLTMVTLDIDETLCAGQEVILEINPSQVAVAKNYNGDLSYSNQIDAKIESIDLGAILCTLILELQDGSKIEAIITAKSAINMSLNKGDEIKAILKASQISLGEVLDA
ncbi:MAG: TOBE domain-containing protein [Sulfurovaceae bacterium]|jgi:molybdopterin-binding protein